jgi:hypothetical protein
MHRALPIAILGLIGVRAGAAPSTMVIAEMPPPGGFEPGKAVESRPFGGEFAGRTLWMSANGRFATVFRVTEDTDRNGKLNIAFGLHGDSWGDALALDVFDIETGKHQRYDDLLSVDSQGRYAVLSRGRTTWLFDSADGSRRDVRDLGGDAAPDGNRCMLPRQISFDSAGERIALLRDRRAALSIYSTATAKSDVIYRPAIPLWRVDFTADPAWMLAIEAPDGFPQEMTSCRSRSRSAFAVSMSSMRVGDEPIDYALIGINGERLAVAEPPVVVSSTTYALPDSGQLLRFRDGPVAVPEGCRFADVAQGSRLVVIGCGDHVELLDPGSGERHAAPAGVSFNFIDGLRAGGPDGTWYAVEISLPGMTQFGQPRRQLGRLRLEDLRLERGPEVEGIQGSRNPGWLIAGHLDGYLLMHLASGRLLTARAIVDETRDDIFALNTAPGSWLLLNPDTRRQVAVNREFRTGNGRGCFIAPSGKRDAGYVDIDVGPWTRVCVD